MTTVRAPLRLTFGGGGSDITKGQGVCLSATIDKYATVSVTSTWDDRYVLHYSSYENVRRIDEIRHRIIQRVFSHFDISPGIQVSSIGEIPAGTGLGSSGAFTVALLKALHPHAPRVQLATWACDLDIGQQDQWSAVYGGFNVYDFAEGVIRPIATPLTADDFALYYTGLRHNSEAILTGATKTPLTAQTQVVEMTRLLEAGDLPQVGIALSAQWDRKYLSCPSREHTRIHGWIETGIDAGAHGGKLIGAGNGGFILFATDTNIDVTMKEAGLCRVPFEFTDDGARCA